MKTSELRNLSKEELFAKLASIKEELSKLQYMKLAGHLDKPHQFKILRKSVARINTLLNEQHLSKKE
jgi:large subunit ribosomal protein L29